MIITDLPTITVAPIGHRIAQVAITLPDVTLGPDWEIILPPAVLAGSGLHQISLSERDIYVEDDAGRYDIIPYTELAMLLEDGPLATVSPVPAAAHTNGHNGSHAR